MNMWHVSNAGVILEINNLLIGIDMITESQIAPYMYQDIHTLKSITNSGILSDLNLLTVTHGHSDHFSCKKTGAFLRKHPQTMFWGSYKATEELIKGEQISPKRFYTENHNKNLNFLKREGVLIQRIPSIHMGNPQLHTEHHSILISFEDFHILFSGDARPGAGFYKSIKEYTDHIHALIAPFPCLGLKSARKCLSQYFLPDKIFLVHLPAPDSDTGNWISSAKKVCQDAHDDLPDPIFCNTLGKCYSLI